MLLLFPIFFILAFIDRREHMGNDPILYSRITTIRCVFDIIAEHNSLRFAYTNCNVEGEITEFASIFCENDWMLCRLATVKKFASAIVLFATICNSVVLFRVS